jgi:hypothetical protein
MLKVLSRLLLLLLGTMLFSQCSSSRNLTFEKAKQEQAAKFFYQDGTQDKGIILKKEGNALLYVSEANHERQTVDNSTIRRMEKLDVVYDFQAYPISEAEIAKVKSNRNTWGYAIGGAVIGGAAGLAVGLPLWYADVDQVPPYFIAGATAVAGSIYFAFKGQNKDRETAIRQIRFMRLSEGELEKQVEDEKKKLDELEKEKQKIQQQLKEKDQESN